MSIGIESVVSVYDGENYNHAVWNQAKEMEPIQPVSHSSLCSATNNVNSLNKEEVDDDLASIGEILV